MNIDFHYGVIYVTSRLAGMSREQAQTVAHACQYVDDATTRGILHFEGGETFERFASAHVMYDYKNGMDDENRVIWAPFHFLPGGQGDTLEEKSVCRPDSEIAREMVRRAIDNRHATNALHRLGVSLHVYVDTWAHQGFCGTESKHNTVLFLEGDHHDQAIWLNKLKDMLADTVHNVEAAGLDVISGLGHGGALHFPDMPWATWKYRNGHLMEISRNNLPDFVQAADMACKVVQGFLSGNRQYDTERGLPPEAKAALQDLLASNRDHDGDERLDVFMQSVAAGNVSGVAEEIPAYIAKGVNSWKFAATGIADKGDGETLPQWSPVFEDSDYRKFHDAIKEHRFVVTQEILPTNGVRLA